MDFMRPWEFENSSHYQSASWKCKHQMIKFCIEVMRDKEEVFLATLSNGRIFAESRGDQISNFDESCIFFKADFWWTIDFYRALLSALQKIRF